MYRPAQTESRKAGKQSDFDLPIYQALFLFCTIVVGLLGVGLFFVMTGRPGLEFAGLILAGLLGRALFFILAPRGEEGEIDTRQTAYGVAIVAAAFPLVFWIMFSWPMLTTYWPFSWETDGVEQVLLIESEPPSTFAMFAPIRIFLVFVALGMMVPVGALAYRFLQELFDPNWSPTRTPVPGELGPAWPWKVGGWLEFLFRDGKGSAREQPIERPAEPPEQEIRTVPVHGVKARRTVTLPAANGKEDRVISVEDLEEFLEIGKSIGFSWLAWDERGWGRTRWTNVCDYLRLHGILAENESGKGTRLAVSIDAARAKLISLTNA